jgi:chromosome segregation protein
MRRPRPLAEAEAAVRDLPDLDAARAAVEAARMAVEAARIAMMTRRSGHDEVRREGEARSAAGRRRTKELSGWKHRLETAERRGGTGRAAGRAEAELDEARAAPEEIAAKREELTEAIDAAEDRAAARPRPLPKAEAALRTAQIGRARGRARWRARHARSVPAPRPGWRPRARRSRWRPSASPKSMIARRRICWR